MSKPTTTYVALLRGINVGGNTLIKMSELKACFEALGFERVTTYINSGNVIFTSLGDDPRRLEATIETALTAQFSFTIRTIVRSLAEMKAILHSLPASWKHPADKRCNVIFLSHHIDTPSIMDNFHPKEDIEEVHYHAGVLFWSAQTSALTKSTMVKIVGTPLYKEMTIRILNTVRKLYDMMMAIDATK